MRKKIQQLPKSRFPLSNNALLNELEWFVLFILIIFYFLRYQLANKIWSKIINDSFFNSDSAYFENRRIREDLTTTKRRNFKRFNDLKENSEMNEIWSKIERKNLKNNTTFSDESNDDDEEEDLENEQANEDEENDDDRINNRRRRVYSLEEEDDEYFDNENRRLSNDSLSDN